MTLAALDGCLDRGLKAQLPAARLPMCVSSLQARDLVRATKGRPQGSFAPLTVFSPFVAAT